MRPSGRIDEDEGAELSGAIETFVRGFSVTRSFTHPYVAARVGPVWVVRDGPRRRADEYRREEWVAHGVGPSEVDRIARAHTRGRFAVCAIRTTEEPAGPLRDAFKARGYRLQTTEPFFVHRLRRIPRVAAPFPVRRVGTEAEADRLAKAVGRRQLLPEHLLPGSPIRQYFAHDGDRVIGWVKSITVGDRAWVSSMEVVPPYRRRGVATSLLARMLRDDRSAGLARSVLLASHAGALLYPRVGYEQIGELMMFTPGRR